jgi:hypothetical protein
MVSGVSLGLARGPYGRAPRFRPLSMRPTPLRPLFLLGAALGGLIGVPSTAFADGDAAPQSAPAPADAAPLMRGPHGQPLEIETVDVAANEAAWAESRAELRVQAAGALQVFIGEVLTTRDDFGARGFSTVVTMLISDPLRGAARAGDIAEFAIPRTAAAGEVVGERPVPVAGYTIVAFVSPEGDLVGGDAMYIVEGGFAWRNRRPSVMFRPSADRDWLNTIDPSQDYFVLGLDELRETVATVRGPSVKGQRRGRSARRR